MALSPLALPRLRATLFALSLMFGSLLAPVASLAQATVDATVRHQRIDGFGAGTAFLYEGQNPMPQDQMDFLYGTDPGEIGLTVIRVRIRPEGGSAWDWAIQNGQKAHQLGAMILATPWTPPSALKSNNSPIGGYLLPEHYADFVDYLNLFLATMAENDAPVSVISLQNEPDYIPDDYEGCAWDAESFRVFSRDFAGGINAPVMLPESFNFNPTVSNPTLNDPAAAANIDYIGGHLYGASVRDYPLAHELGKPTWMTEFLLNDQTIQSALATGRQISDCLTVGNMSAYIWWKLIGDANGLLNNAAQPQRRAYVMAQFSRFVRPGYVRIGSSISGPLSLCAFKDPSTGRFAIIVTNATSASVEQSVNLSGFVARSVTPWVTSANVSLAEQSPVSIEDGAFSYQMPAFSIATFVGEDLPDEGNPLNFSQFLTSRSLSDSEHGFVLDWDGDSMATGYEYLIGSNPEAEDFAGISWSRNDGVDTLSLPVSPLVGQGVLVIQSSANLATWATEASYDFSSNASDGLEFGQIDERQVIVFSKAYDPISGQRFYRIRFSQSSL